MAKPQEKAMIMDNKQQDLKEIADDSDHAKSKNMSHDDHIALAKTAENATTSESKIMTRYVNVQEDMVKYLRGEDIVLDLQLASGAMIQLTGPLDEEADAKYRPVRVIGKVENIDKAEKLIKAFIALVDVGGSSLLFKDYGDSDGYVTKYDGRDSGKLPVQCFRHGQRRSCFLRRPYGQRHYRSRSLYGKRPYGRRYSSSGFDDSDTDRYSSEYDSDDSYRRSRSRKWPYGWRHSRYGTNSYSSDYDSDRGYRRSPSPSPSPKRPYGQRRG